MHKRDVREARVPAGISGLGGGGVGRGKVGGGEATAREGWGVDDVEVPVLGG
jgi:hypothetical protein